MIGASKILTVSYGTFSCTLEGFDEPFNTMKAIAEYFRDLAAEDRYFGAEPPTPDAAMLHRIAEREIQRRVEAKIQDNGVILRAGDPEPAALAPPAIQPSVSTAEQTDATGESVAARLSRLRASQATQSTAMPTTAFDDTYNEDQHADDILAGFTGFDTSDATTDLGGFDASTDAGLNTSALQDLIAPEDAAAPILEEIEAVEARDAEEAPVTANTAAEDFLPEYVADADIAFGAEYDDEFDTGANTEFNDETMLASVSTLIAENDHVETSVADVAVAQDDVYEDLDLSETEAPFAADPGFEDDEDEADAMLQRFADAAATDVQGALIDDDTAYSTLEAISAPLLDDAEDAQAFAEPEAAPEQQPRARARVIKIRRADVAAQPEPAPATSLLSPEAEAALQAELAELEAENISPETAAPMADAQEPASVAPSPRPVRPVRQIAVRAPSAEVATNTDQDLDLEAAVNAAMTSGDAAEPVLETAEPVAEDPAPDLSEGRKLLDASTQDDDVSRLMAHTNSEMDDGENRRRHNAIAHLKAAVAATEAERQIAATNPGKPQQDRQDAYRNDLQSVVRQQSADPRPTNADRPSPLVLVSEQRIDRKPNPSATVPVLATSTDPATPRVIMPVRPRRMQQTAANAQDTLLGSDEDDLEDDIVSADEDVNMFVEGNSFADFAEKLGATTLPELLEASAVYCAQVLGRPQFSRPLVMRQLDTLIGAPDHSREDGLRVFGTLLRQGRIAKVKRGQFAVTDRSPLLAEALRNAG